MPVTLQLPQCKNLNKSQVLAIKFRADEGNINEQCNYAYCCLNGFGIPKNLDMYIHYLTLAAHNNDLSATAQLAAHYEKGEHVNPNLTKALSLYFRAALQGETYSIQRLKKLNAQSISSASNENHHPYDSDLKQHIEKYSIYPSITKQRPGRWKHLSAEEYASVKLNAANNDPIALNDLGVELVEQSFDKVLTQQGEHLLQIGIEYIANAALLGNMSAVYNYVHYALLSGINSDVNLYAAYQLLNKVAYFGNDYAGEKSKIVFNLIKWIENKKRMNIQIDVQQGYDKLKQLMNEDLKKSAVVQGSTKTVLQKSSDSKYGKDQALRDADNDTVMAEEDNELVIKAGHGSSDQKDLNEKLAQRTYSRGPDCANHLGKSTTKSVQTHKQTSAFKQVGNPSLLTNKLSVSMTPIVRPSSALASPTPINAAANRILQKILANKGNNVVTNSGNIPQPSVDALPAASPNKLQEVTPNVSPNNPTNLMLIRYPGMVAQQQNNLNLRDSSNGISPNNNELPPDNAVAMEVDSVAGRELNLS